MTTTKPAAEYTSIERRVLFSQLAKEILSRMTPNVGPKFSGQQITYAKGRAWKQMREAGF
jgi:hypothetical protein